MNKIAELVRDAEVRGALAAFVDAGLVKVASQEAFDELVGAVCTSLGEDDYDLQKVAAVTDAILGAEDKTAAQNDEFLRNAALGELLQMKVAGQIDDATFQNTAAELMSKEANVLKGVGGIARNIFKRKPADFASTPDTFLAGTPKVKGQSLKNKIFTKVPYEVNKAKARAKTRIENMTPTQKLLAGGAAAGLASSAAGGLADHLLGKYRNPA